MTNTNFIFNSVVKPLVEHWRFSSLKITYFLDDRLGVEYNHKEAKHKLCSRKCKKNGVFLPS